MPPRPDAPDDPLIQLAHAAHQQTDLTAHASCLECGYALRGLPHPRCPECGRPFDPLDGRTMRLPAWLHRRLFPPPRSAFSRGVDKVLSYLDRLMGSRHSQHVWLAGTATALCLAWQFRFNEAAALVAFPWGLIAWAALGVNSLRVRRWPSADRRWRKYALILLLATIALNIGYERCPHARWLYIGPIPLSLGPGRCHNPRHPHTLLFYLLRVPPEHWGRML